MEPGYVCHDLDFAVQIPRQDLTSVNAMEMTHYVLDEVGSVVATQQIHVRIQSSFKKNV